MGDTLRGWFDPSGISAWDVAFAVLSVVAGWIASRFARRGTLALVSRVPGLSPTTRSLAGRVIKYTVILLGVGIGLTFLGASVQPVLAMAVIVGVVLVLALRGISDNLAAGVILQVRQPVRIGDFIQCDDHAGVVRELNARSVVISTLDGSRVHVPNAYLLANPLVNHSTAGGRRDEVEVRVATRPSSSTASLTELVAATVGGVPGVLATPPIRVLVTTIAPDRVTLRARFWHDPITAAATLSVVVSALADVLARHDLVATVTSDLPAPPLTGPPPV